MSPFHVIALYKSAFILAYLHVFEKMANFLTRHLHDFMTSLIVRTTSVCTVGKSDRNNRGLLFDHLSPDVALGSGIYTHRRITPKQTHRPWTDR